jgi:hypothetical protein
MLPNFLLPCLERRVNMLRLRYLCPFIRINNFVFSSCQFGGLCRAQGSEERLTCACPLETLEEILCGHKINASLRNDLGSGVITEPVSHHALDLDLCEGLSRAQAQPSRLLLCSPRDCKNQ